MRIECYCANCGKPSKGNKNHQGEYICDNCTSVLAYQIEDEDS